MIYLLAKYSVWTAVPLSILSSCFLLYAFFDTSDVQQTYFRFALWTFVGVVFLMELRVRLVGAGIRDILFWVHLISGLILLPTLLALGYLRVVSLLEWSALTTAIVSVSTGLPLLSRAVKRNNQ